jgi:hypothetical protein
MANRKTFFSLQFPENLKRDANLPSTKNLAFDDLGDFIEEREKIKRILEKKINTELKVDYSTFSNHVFYDSAYQKFSIAKDRILDKYPYNGNSEEKEAYFLTSSGYENYVLNYQWPQYVGYLSFNTGSNSATNQYISASDYDSKLNLGSASLYVSTWLKDVKISGTLPMTSIFQVISASVSSGLKFGYELFLSASNTIENASIRFNLYSGSQIAKVSASYHSFTGSSNNVSAIYDQPTGILSLYINETKVKSASVNFGPIEFGPGAIKVLVGSGSQYVSPSSVSSSYNFFSGTIDELRIFHTASELFHIKNFNRSVDSENYLMLRYSFNEGITGFSFADSKIIDYSKNGIHGEIMNYSSATNTMRSSGTLMRTDHGMPILYPFHSGVVSLTATLYQSASIYDDNNPNFIIYQLPEYILNQDDEQEGLLTSFSLALARYFDDIKLYVDQFENLRLTNYDNVNETPDLFLPYLKRYFGWKATEHFNDANPLEFYFGENVLLSGNLQVPLSDIRNQFWRRVLNNLPYLYSTKGKRNNIDALFNVLGINKNILSLKEYGYLPGGSLQDTRIHKEKAVSVMGITGTLSSSYIKISNALTSSLTSYTVESLLQLPSVSSSYTISLTQGSIWQFTDAAQVTGSFSLVWNRSSAESDIGKLILTSSDGQNFSSSDISIFNDQFIHVAAGLNATIPFIQVRTIDNDILNFTASYSGSVALSGVFTGSKYDFIIGASSGSYQRYFTKGYFSEFRFWSRFLSSSEVDAHALHFENTGIRDPREFPHPLVGHWPLNENISSSAGGFVSPVLDHSRRGLSGSGVGFISENKPYRKFLLPYNYLSPSVDLKWTENKIRIRDNTFLKKSEIANDTNEVSLEFNFVDALNEDIMKIFSSFDILNNAIGFPVNKYREEYSDLEAYRRIYFDRLGDTLNFNKFFLLFTWFDKKISDSIKQLLPARVKFIGGEQVVESHFLERNKYKYQYPIFRTPVDMPDVDLSKNERYQLNNHIYPYFASLFTSASVLSRQLENKIHLVRYVTPTAEVAPVIRDIYVHNSGIFAVGSSFSASDGTGFGYSVFSSSDNGDSWQLIDFTSSQANVSSSNICNSIKIDNSGAIYARRYIQRDIYCIFWYN